MNNLKRFLALMLAMCMMLTAVPFGAFAAESDEQTEVSTESVTQQPELSIEAVTEAPESETEAADTSDNEDVSAMALTIGDKPADGTVSGQPFDPSVSANYRIPGLVNHNGTLIASADARWDYEKDGGGMDLVVSRSTDGSTWNYTFAGYLGDNGNEWDAYSSTLMDPVIISDGSTLYLLADMFPAGYSISGGNTANDASNSSSTAYTVTDTATGFDGNGNLLLSADNRSTYGYYLKDGKIYTTAGEEQTAYTVDSWFNLYENKVKKTNLFFSDSPFQVRATSYICLLTSTDGGENWTNNGLLNVKPNGVAWMVLGPGSGVVTQDGNLAFTAYDNSNIYLVYGKDGQWNTVQTSAATNESSIIELNDGTIRAFVKRKGSNTIAYVDFTKNANGGYNAGGLVSTNDGNFSNCMVSSLHYSKTLNGQEVVLVCCPSKPGAGDWNGRFNGKIHMFTLDGSNNMTLVNSYALNGESEFFAYSNMAELDDGTIGVLYEDDCISYSAGNYYGNASHITYKNVNLETALNVTFDIMYKDVAWNADSAAGSVEVPVSSGVTSVYAQQAEVSSLTKYIAYDMHLCGTTDCTGTCGNAYTGAATVTLPLTEELKNTGVAGFVVETDGTVTYIYNVKNDGENVTFEVPHFSVVGLAEAFTSEQDVVLDLSESWEYTDNSGYYVDSYTGAGLDTSIAKVEVTGTNQAAGTDYETVSSVTTEDEYIIQRNGRYLTATAGTTSDRTQAAVWQFVYSGGYKLKLKDSSNYLTYNYYSSSLSVGSSGTPFRVNGDTITYNGPFSDPTIGTAIKKVATPEVKTTNIKITGLSAGKTSVIVGSTKYNITVNPIVRDIELYVGKSDKFTIEGAYGMADVKVSPDSAIATLDKMEHVSVAATKVLTAVTTIESGKQYIIVNKRANGDISGALDTTHAVLTATADGDSLSMNGPVSEDCTEFWTITQSGNGYTIMRDGKYLTMGNGTSAVTTTETVVTLDNTDSRGWLISYNGYYLSDMYGTSSTKAHGYSQRDDGGNFWTIYEVVTTSTTTNTEVTFTGVKAGNATATIGSVVFNITVKQDTRDITLYSGQDKTFTIAGSGYSMDDVKAYPDAAYATIVNVTSTGAELVPVTQIESGKHYLIVNAQTGDVLTNTAVSATGSWDAKPGLDTTGKAAADSTELWTISDSADGKYTVTRDGKYLTVSGFYAVMSDTETALTLNYTDSGWTIMDNTTCLSLAGHVHKDYYLSDNVGEGYDEAALGTGDMSAYCYWNIYEINASGSTNVTFHGVKPTTTPTTATIGHVLYNITVMDGPTIGDIEDFNNIVGKGTYSDNNIVNPSARSDLDMTGKVIKSLRITEGASFLLDVDVKEYDSVVWSTVNPSVATVDENGNVTAVAAGETDVIATVVKNGVEESISIKVTVVPSLLGENSGKTSFIFYYIEQVDDTDPYYTMFLSTESTTEPVDGHRLVKVSEGEVIWYERPKNSAFGWVWTADPWEGYALTYMASTGSVSQYYPLKDTESDELQLGESDYNSTTAQNPGYYYKYSISYKNIESVGNDDGASWRSQLDAVLGEAIVIGRDTWDNYGCDGAMSNTRSVHDGVPDLVTSMTFISDPMPQITKKVNGILPTTKKRADFREYKDGMTATVDEYVYFQIDITVNKPTVWTDEANGIGAITYTDAIVTDTALKDGYFYVQANDTNMNGVIDGDEIGQQLQTSDITDQLNAAWDADEQTRTISLYLVYKIVSDDIPRFNITNTADLAWEYQSHYSTGALSGKADAEATITVVGHTMDNVVIDFGQSFTYSGLNADHLKYAYVGADAKYTAKYGTVTVTGSGTTTKDDIGTYYSEYVVTYTPTTILQTHDIVSIYGQGENGEKVINSFLVYPATTVYYEEGFMQNMLQENVLVNTNDGWTTGAKATMDQEFEKLNEAVYDSEGTLTGYASDKTHPYGYDPIYNGDGTNDITPSSIYSNNVGDTTSFQFTGTGFELYANCTTGTGRVAVSVYKADGSLEQMYVVNTVAAEGTSNATDGQGTNLNSLPIVCVKDMAHGTYTVKLTKVVKNSGPVYIDGVRIINTVKDSSVFQIDLEDNPEFYQLRDYVLKAVGVDSVNDSMYAQLGENPSISQIADQIYAGISSDGEAPAAMITSGTGTYGNVDVQDLLDNGPKNELFLRANQALTFSVTTDRLMQIGLKAPAGETSYSISYTGKTITGKTITGSMNTSVDMFYELGNTRGTSTTYTITVTNTGSNILSVTDLKICDDPNAVFVPLTVEDIKATLVTMGYGVAENTTTGESFETVSAALTAAKAGETVKLLADCTESTVMVTSGVTLDLNGCKLTASYAVAMDGAHIVDNLGTGSMIIGLKNLILDEENAMIPVYNGEGYVFTKAGFAVRQDTKYTGEGFKIQAMAYPVQMAVVDLLKDGGADNNIEIIIRLTWDTDQGTGSQDFKFTDAVVASVYSSNTGSWSSYSKMFSMVVSGFESIENLKANIIVVSGTDAEYVSSTSVDIT